MARDDPFAEIERVFEQLSEGLGDLDPGAGVGAGAAVDLVDAGEAYELVVDLPGFDSEAIDVTLPDAATVRVAASRETETAAADDESRYVRRERSHRTVDRTVSLPERVDADETTATFDNGVLTVTLPKRVEHEGTSIDVE